MIEFWRQYVRLRKIVEWMADVRFSFNSGANNHSLGTDFILRDYLLGSARLHILSKSYITSRGTRKWLVLRGFIAKISSLMAIASILCVPFTSCLSEFNVSGAPQIMLRYAESPLEMYKILEYITPWEIDSNRQDRNFCLRIGPAHFVLGLV